MQKDGEEQPDAFLENEVLKDNIETTEHKCENATILAEKAKSTYDKLLK